MDRPRPEEYPPFYETYVSAVPGGDVFDHLREQGRAFSALVRGLSTAEAEHRYAPGKWSVKEVIGHVNDAERILATRGLVIARSDPTPYPGFDENAYVEAAGFEGRSIVSLADEFEGLRASTVALFGELPSDVAHRTGEANGQPFTVRAIVYIVAGHERHHQGVLHERYGVGGGVA